tara:strand:+ start:8986 stop:9852 length:867 start_codon:yes stop_codon:yes gene_type:complete
MERQKLGIAYNVFDGEELLPYSLKGIRGLAEYIVVVYQTTSNYGNENKNLLPFLEKLVDAKMVDELVEYEPQLNIVDELGNPYLKKGSVNEQTKRNIGLQKCLDNGCTIFSSMDTDELYHTQDYKNALDSFIDGGYDSSFCQMQTYYKTPTMVVTPPERYFVPLFYKISGRRETLKFEFIHDYQIKCDGTRMIKAGFPKMYTRDEIQMHHFSYVRNDMKSKVDNSSAQMTDGQKALVVHHYENWTKGMKAFFLGNQIFDLDETDNEFDIRVNEKTHKIEFPNLVNESV